MHGKWVEQQKTLSNAHIIVVKDDHLPRNEWKLACVEQTLPTDDGFIWKVILATGAQHLDSQDRRTQEIQAWKD